MQCSTSRFNLEHDMASVMNIHCMWFWFCSASSLFGDMSLLRHRAVILAFYSYFSVGVKPLKSSNLWLPVAMLEEMLCMHLIALSLDP